MQYVVSVINDTAALATPAEMESAPDLDAALKLAAEGPKHCNRKVEVRPLLTG